VSAVSVVDAYLSGLDARPRRLADAEWGLTLDLEGQGEQPLEVGVRVADGLLRAQALAVRADARLDPSLLLHWNRQTRLVRFGSTRAGDIWVHADAPVAGLDERGVDRLLGLLVEAAMRAREYAAAVAAAGGSAPEAPRPASGSGAPPPAAAGIVVAPDGRSWRSRGARPRAAG
jgi:Putative bacterial sensory transduction regulator